MKLDLPLTKETEHSIHIRVGQNLRAIRECRGMPIQDAAPILGISYQQMQKYETAKNRLSIGKALVLAHLFNVPISALTDSAVIAPNHIPQRARYKLIRRIQDKLPSLSLDTLKGLEKLINGLV